MSRGVTVKSPERVAEAIAMRERGMLLREIAAHFGVGLSTVAMWLTDPDGARAKARAKAREDVDAAPCVDCGAPTSGRQKGGRRDEPRCRLCAARIGADKRRIWTREAIVIAMQEWAHEHGEPPAVADWDPYLARIYLHEERAARFAAGKWPSRWSVVHEFGSWNAAIEAAGFAPRARGRARGSGERAT